jgi:hypothetical protein
MKNEFIIQPVLIIKKMKKLVLFAAFALAVSFTACNKEAKTEGQDVEETPVEQVEETIEPVEPEVAPEEVVETPEVVAE